MKQQTNKIAIPHKKMWISVMILIIFAWASSLTKVSAHTTMMDGSSEQTITENQGHGASLDEVLTEILTSQQVESTDQINCNKISEHQLEELGDAVMSEMHPNNEIHERMDAMMGGEGSESLKQAHINMALNYLKCNGNNDYNTITDQDMMGGIMNMMGWTNNQSETRGGGYNMMGYGNWGTSNTMFGHGGVDSIGGSIISGFDGILWLLNSILFAVLLIVMIRYFWIKGYKKRK